MQILPMLRTCAMALATLVALSAGPGCGPSPVGAPGGAGDVRPIVVGTEAAYPPFESVEPNGDIVGLDIDLVRALGARLGRPVTIRNMQFDALIPELQAGRIDVVASGMSRLPERALKVDFSRPYARIIMSILLSTSRAADVKTAADLDRPGVVIAVQRGTSGEVKAKAAFPKAEIRPFDNQVDASKEVAAGRAHAFVYDMVSVRKLAEKEPAALRVLGETLGSEDYCMAFAKGSPLLAPANAFLDEAAQPGGLLGRLVETWKPDAESAPVDAK